MEFTEAFTAAQRQVLAELSGRDARERQAGIREASSLMAVAPAVARLLYTLAVGRGAVTMVEFGTSHGYATVHLAAAAERTGGHVYTVDALAEKTAAATANLRRAGLLHRVTLVTADGAEFARGLPRDVDFVLVDYPAPAFLPAFDTLRDCTRPGCLLFVDGGPEDHWKTGGRGLLARLEADPDFLVSVLPMQKMQLLAVRLS